MSGDAETGKAPGGEPTPPAPPPIVATAAASSEPAAAEQTERRATPVSAPAQPDKAGPTLTVEPWWRNKLRLEQTGAFSAALSAISVLVAVGTYLYNKASDPKLAIAAPAVVELRCSDPLFDPANCWSPALAGDYSLSATGAFRIQADGPADQNVSLDRATARVTLGDVDVELQAFWSVNLTPGKEDSRRQVVPVSLAGGQTVSQEVWFAPLQRVCVGEGKRDPACRERADFRDWQSFVKRHVEDQVSNYRALAASAPGSGASWPQGKVIFNFHWSRNGKPVDEPLCVRCTFDIGETVYRAVDRPQPISITVRCAESLKRVAEGNASCTK